MTEQETIEAMRTAYRFGQEAGCLQDQMELAYRVCMGQARAAIRNEVLEEAAIAMGTYHWNRYKEDGLSTPAMFTSHTHQHVEEILRAMKGTNDE